MFQIEQRRLIAPLFIHRPVTGRMIFGVLAQYLSRIGDWDGSVIDTIQKRDSYLFK
jgi:hypothetical protein